MVADGTWPQPAYGVPSLVVHTVGTYTAPKDVGVPLIVCLFSASVGSVKAVAYQPVVAVAPEHLLAVVKLSHT
jgi:hypothetical protein